MSTDTALLLSVPLGTLTIFITLLIAPHKERSFDEQGILATFYFCVWMFFMSFWYFLLR